MCVWVCVSVSETGREKDSSRSESVMCSESTFLTPILHFPSHPQPDSGQTLRVFLLGIHVLFTKGKVYLETNTHTHTHTPKSEHSHTH